MTFCSFLLHFPSVSGPASERFCTYFRLKTVLGREGSHHPGILLFSAVFRMFYTFWQKWLIIRQEMSRNNRKSTSETGDNRAFSAANTVFPLCLSARGGLSAQKGQKREYSPFYTFSQKLSETVRPGYKTGYNPATGSRSQQGPTVKRVVGRHPGSSPLRF